MGNSIPKDHIRSYKQSRRIQLTKSKWSTQTQTKSGYSDVGDNVSSPTSVTNIDLAPDSLAKVHL